MIKTFNINLAGQIFNINEDAYEHLSQYFNSLRTFYANEEDKDEIIRDIEARFAELFLAKGKSYIITKQDAVEVVNLMGNPQEFDEENAQQSNASSNSNSNTNSTNTFKTGKKLYRDVDNSVVAGVCAGLSSYIGISDPIWVRIAFIILTLFTATFWMFVMYPILWFILPEATTAAQKLEMKGEAINLSNIEKKIKDETFLEKPKGVINQIIAFLGATLLIFFKILLWLGIAVAILTGGSIVFALLIALIVLAGIALVGIPFVNTYFFTNNSDGWLLGLGGLLAGMIPIIVGIVALVHIFSKTVKPLTKKFIFPMIGLFFFGLLLINISGYHAKQLLSEKKRINQTFPLNYAYKSDTLQISINPSIKDEDYEDVNINGVSDLIDFINDHDDKFIPVEIEIFESANDSFTIVKEFSAQGKNDNDAVQNATSFRHNIAQINNKIIIDPYIQFDMKKAKFRNQKLRVKVYVPEGKVIKWDKRTERYINLHKISINYDAGNNMSVPPIPPVPPAPPIPGNQNHKIEIKTSKNGDTAKSSQVVINIDSDNENVNDVLDKVQEKIDEERETQAEKEANQVEIDAENYDNEFEARIQRHHYTFKMVNGELVPID